EDHRLITGCARKGALLTAEKAKAAPQGAAFVVWGVWDWIFEGQKRRFRQASRFARVLAKPMEGEMTTSAI
ncbi:hypothetical protein, partial [Sulfitobacter sp. EhC04]|uniref:hypothetical protein n=1 Tax=Sulfitobacter sp. EhC04 TaxID=1849168 RepID=UPI001F2A9D22